MIGRIIRALVLGFALALSPGAGHAQSAAPAAVQPIQESVWAVTASWQTGPGFSWVFWTNGRYLDTDGPTGSWTQSSAALTLNADAGFTYRAQIDGDAMHGTVYDKAGAVAGTFTAKRVGRNQRPTS
ncbi:MAG TPA: hypothetical protein VG735_08750 [Caulobacterales bacterium]|jgi:hypothetical protein|nr:hypothetical protein [Caulobacterales bacterium]